FVVYHILHFTVRVPGMGVYEMNPATDMVNVYTMVVSGFHQAFTVLLYVVGMIFLALHVSHGFQSFWQSLGTNNDRTLPAFVSISKVFAVIVLLGYSSIPLLIIFGLVQ
ncbi:MAG TPA: succinate dehydrogenase/fumarate reductase cytochrome b subunit, partial [Desulfuromonadales bacterium]|nr:succinate dehydrogenase/fumarate reductase cytochrome b subunit [Desulfuromonadales bacterium]